MASSKTSGGGGGGGAVTNGLGLMTTRNHRPPLFSEDEKVLCYEPDQKKARVLYDSKVLEVVEKKDKNGKMHYEYKIHFQGWNSSWDRYVREENVLKDAEKNRTLQRELNKAAQLLCRTNVKKKNKRKTILEKLKAATQAKDGNNSKNGSFRGENGNCSSGSGQGLFMDIDNKDGSEADQFSSDEEEFVNRPPVTVEVPPNLKTVLEHDYFYVKEGQKLMRLPTRLTVVELLENYIQYKASEEIEAFTLRRTHQLKNLNQTCSKNATAARKSGASPVKGGTMSSGNSISNLVGSKSSRSKADLANEDLIKTFARINESKRICEDIRVMFDFLLFQMLLYENEQEQYRHFLKDYYNLIRIPNDDALDEYFEESSSNSSASQQKPVPDLSNIDPKILMPPPPPPPPSKSSPRYSDARSRVQSTSTLKQQLENHHNRQTETTPPIQDPPTAPPAESPLSTPINPPDSPKSQSSSAEQERNLKTSDAEKDSSKTTSIASIDTTTSVLDESTAGETCGTGAEEPPSKRKKSRLSSSEPSSSKGSADGDARSDSTSEPSSTSAPQKVTRRCDLHEKCEYPWACEQLNEFMDELITYRMLPYEVVYNGEVHPSLCYGAVHLLRLFVSIPEILEKTMIHPKKLKIVLCELNRILGYISTLKDLISQNDWYNPMAKLFEEDFLQETGQLPKTSTTLSSSEDATTSRSSQPPVQARQGRSQRAPPEEESSPSPEITIKIDLSTVKEEGGPNPVLKVDGGRHFERRVKRNPPRTSTGRAAEPTIIEGHALGVRKSLSVEELSRETLVAPNCPAGPPIETPKKAYSLRMHRRVPYKT